MKGEGPQAVLFALCQVIHGLESTNIYVSIMCWQWHSSTSEFNTLQHFSRCKFMGCVKLTINNLGNRNNWFQALSIVMIQIRQTQLSIARD